MLLIINKQTIKDFQQSVYILCIPYSSPDNKSVGGISVHLKKNFKFFDCSGEQKIALNNKFFSVQTIPRL